MRNIYQKPATPTHSNNSSPQVNHYMNHNNNNNNQHNDMTISSKTNSSYLISKNSPCHPSNNYNNYNQLNKTRLNSSQTNQLNSPNGNASLITKSSNSPATQNNNNNNVSNSTIFSLHSNSSDQMTKFSSISNLNSNYQNINYNSNTNNNGGNYENHNDVIVMYNSPKPLQQGTPNNSSQCQNIMKHHHFNQHPPQSPLSKPPPLPPQIYSNNLLLKNNSPQKPFANKNIQSQKPIASVSPTPIIIQNSSNSSSSSSYSSSTSSPVMKTKSKISTKNQAINEDDQNQNERFFDSSTLYRKELKQKQRDILSSSTSSSSLLNNSSTTNHMHNSFIELSSTNNSLNDSNVSNKHLKLLNNSGNNSKMLNLFSNLLNRNKNSNSNNACENNSEINNANYVKNLKRATSSTQFSSNNSSATINNKTKLIQSEGLNKLLFNPSSLFNNNNIHQDNGNKINNHNSMSNLALNESNSSKKTNSPILSNIDNINDDSIISIKNDKFENIAFSTKNNGLLFLPTSPQSTSRTRTPSPDYTGSNLQQQKTITNSSSSSKSQPVQLNIVDLSKKSPSDKNSPNKLNQEAEDNNAFENHVYSYVDNLRHHSKRLSEINLLNNQTSASLAAAAAAAAVVQQSNSSPSSKKPSPTSSFSSSISSSSSISKSSSASACSQQLAAAASAVQIHLSNSFNNNYSVPIKNSTTSTTSNVAINKSLFEKKLLVNNNYNNLKPTNSNSNLAHNNSNHRPQIISNNNKWSKSQSINANLNIISSSSSSASSSSSVNQFFQSSSISPKSICSSETVVINNHNVLNECGKTVLSLRDKFEQISNHSQNSSQNDLNKIVEQQNHNISIDNCKYSSKKQQLENKDYFNCSYEAMSNLDQQKQTVASNNQDQDLSISTTSSLMSEVPVINQISVKQHQTQFLNSPTPSSVSSTSSTTSSSALLSNENHNSNNNITVLPITHITTNTISSSLSSSSSYEHLMTHKEFYSYNDLYKINRYYNDYENGSDIDYDLNKYQQSNKFFLTYQKLINQFMANFYSQNISIQYLLDPILNLSFNNHDNQKVQQVTTSNHVFKLTVDFFKSILSNNKIFMINSNDSKSMFDIIENEDVDIYENADLTKLEREHNLNMDISTLSNINSNNCDSEICLYLNKDLLNKSNIVTNNSNTIFSKIKQKLKYLLFKKLQYFSDQLVLNSTNNDLNETIGKKILKLLEEGSNLTSLELDKYKLLVSETDVIINLLLKLCNKMANTENLIQIKQIESQTLKLSDNKSDNELNEDMDLLKQELTQIQRKKEEALFLKNGIDKRAVNVSSFLLNYLTKSELDEFEQFLHMKWLNALQIRHTKDHIEMTKIQIILLNQLSQV